MVLILLAALVLLSQGWALGRAPLSKTEGVRALTGHQMLASGEWVVPRLYGSVYLRKPPLFYWAVAGSERVTGQASEWAWRLPSVVSAALLAVLLGVMGRRWFGPGAGLVSGLSLLFIVAMWSQNRSAEIDTLNNLCSATAACALLELGFGAPRRRWVWALLLMLGTAGALMAKGPAGFPVILGALFGGSWATGRWKAWVRPAVIFGLLAGIGIFLLWTWGVKVELSRPGSGADLSGLREVATRLSPISRFRKDGLDILTLPLVLLAYAFPLSAALFLAGPRRIRKRMKPDEAVMAAALTGTFIVSILIGIPALVSNPRYLYMALPMLCLLCGASWRAGESGALGPKSLRAARVITGIFALAGLGGLAVFTLLGWTGQTAENIVLLPAALVGASAGLAALVALQRSRPLPALWLTTLQCVCMSLAFSAFKNAERVRESGAVTGRALAEILPQGTLVHAERMIFAHPEVIHYAGLKVQRYPGEIREHFVPSSSGWYLLHPREWNEWGRSQGSHLSQVQRMPGPDEPYLAWFEWGPSP